MIFLCGLILIAALYLLLIGPCFRRRLKNTAIFGDFAHRGLHRTGIPENCMAAFEKAVDAGYGIELDVQLTRDNKVVVFHDYTLERMCGVSGSISEMTYNQLAELNLLDTNHKIPLFEDVLKTVEGKVPLIIEIKSESTNLSVCGHVYRLLKNYGGEFCVQSFNALVLYWFSKNAPGIIRGQLSANLTKGAKDKLFLKFLTRHLLLNFLSRPDYIAYKYRDTKNISFRINKKLFKIPTAVWTIDNIDEFYVAKSVHNIVIFEQFKP